MNFPLKVDLLFSVLNSEINTYFCCGVIIPIFLRIFCLGDMGFLTFQTCGDPGISAFPEGDNIFSWIGTIKGSNATVYEGLSYKLTLKFPTDYPFKPPVVKFDTLCFHPNVDQFGNICLDILQVLSTFNEIWFLWADIAH